MPRRSRKRGLSESVEHPLQEELRARGVLHARLTQGGQTIEDTGPLPGKHGTIDRRSPTVHSISSSVRPRRPASSAGESTRMQSGRTEGGVKGKTGLGVYPDGMVEHDGHVGELLAKLDQLGSPTTPSSCTRPTTAPRMQLPDAHTPFRAKARTGRRLARAAAIRGGRDQPGT